MSDKAIDAAAKVICKWLDKSWDGLSDRDISGEFPDWAYPNYGPVLQGGKPALRRIMRAAIEAYERVKEEERRVINRETYADVCVHPLPPPPKDEPK